MEYALSRTLSPALIAEYQTQLPDKKLLQAKLHEFYLQDTSEGAVSAHYLRIAVELRRRKNRSLTRSPQLRIGARRGTIPGLRCLAPISSTQCQAQCAHLRGAEEVLGRPKEGSEVDHSEPSSSVCRLYGLNEDSNFPERY